GDERSSHALALGPGSHRVLHEGDVEACGRPPAVRLRDRVLRRDPMLREIGVRAAVGHAYKRRGHPAVLTHFEPPADRPGLNAHDRLEAGSLGRLFGAATSEAVPFP